MAIADPTLCCGALLGLYGKKNHAAFLQVPVLSLSLKLICWQTLHWQAAGTTAKCLQEGFCRRT